MPRYRVILEATRRLIAQVPDERMHERVIPNRDRTIRLLCHHMFRIAESFVEAWDGAEYTAQFHSLPPAADIQTARQIVAYGDAVRARFEAWWDRVEDRSCGKTLITYFGPCPAHDLLERSTWHTAQHCRQLADVLTRLGIAPDRPLTPEQLAGLPLPERLYE
ncbi:MAG TPA: DinB family protein [Candidatus Methylomirabilis sp.]|nr:DinB family protein [Candidatus Methylomirabilis sp.]